MLKVTVELDVHGLGIKTIPLGVIEIWNDGLGTRERGNYGARAISKNGKPLMKRSGRVENHPRLSKPVWNLVYKILSSMGYNK